MAPTFIRLHDFKPRAPSNSTFIREAGTMHVQSTLYSRSVTANSSSSGSVDKNTIIFIVVGVVCLFVVLIGFYFVSRPRVASNPAPSVPSSHPQHSPITQPPHPLPGCGENTYWKKIWKRWRHGNPHPPTTADTPTSQVFPAAATITNPPQIISSGDDDSETYPPIVSRPSPTRRITFLSVSTSFSHSHITEEELNNFRLSAYDLDGDLEEEMLNSATDDVWPGRALAFGDYGSVGVDDAIKVEGSATPITEGSVEGHVPPRVTAQWKGGDYENLGASQSMASGDTGVEGDVVELHKAVMESQ